LIGLVRGEALEVSKTSAVIDLWGALPKRSAHLRGILWHSLGLATKLVICVLLPISAEWVVLLWILPNRILLLDSGLLLELVALGLLDLLKAGILYYRLHSWLHGQILWDCLLAEEVLAEIIGLAEASIGWRVGWDLDSHSAPAALAALRGKAIFWKMSQKSRKLLTAGREPALARLLALTG